MEIVISHMSALEYWRLYGHKKINKDAKKRRKRLQDTIPSLSLVCELVPEGLSPPVNLLIGTLGARRKSKMVRPRVYTRPVPEWGFIETGNGVTVCSPAFCFFQMAAELPLLRLIELGYELCGSYSLPVGESENLNPGSKAAGNPGSKAIGKVSEAEQKAIGNPGSKAAGRVSEAEQKAADKLQYSRTPLTNIKALTAFAPRMKGAKGYKNAKRALHYIIDGSASPMETILVMMLTLPHKLGGYGLPKPEMNKRIEIGKAAKHRPDRAFYKCDLIWEKAAFAVEYDSDMFHAGADRIAEDSMKRFDMSVLGIEPISLTNRQIRNAVEFDAFAKLIAAKLGKQLRFRSRQYPAAQRELRGLLPGNDASFNDSKKEPR